MSIDEKPNQDDGSRPDSYYLDKIAMIARLCPRTAFSKERGFAPCMTCGGIWPCPNTKVGWLARRLDPDTQHLNAVRACLEATSRPSQDEVQDSPHGEPNTSQGQS